MDAATSRGAAAGSLTKAVDSAIEGCDVSGGVSVYDSAGDYSIEELGDILRMATGCEQHTDPQTATQSCQLPGH